jgi:fluoride exporter
VARLVPILLVACGGALGAVARFVVGDAFSRRFGTAWPYGTLFINVTGSFLIALFFGAAARRTALDETWRYLFPVGFVGAYTTFSTYELETHRLFQLGQAPAAATYVVVSNVLGFVAVVAGAAVGRRL